MNFVFREGDEVVVRPGLTISGRTLMIEKDFGHGIFWCRDEKTRELFRLRSTQLMRARRPSEDQRKADIAARKAERTRLKLFEEARIRKNREEFVYITKHGVRLTAKGLPDQRVKHLKYTAATSPIKIKVRPRGGI